MSGIFAEMSEKYDLEGKKVVLVLGHGLSLLRMKLPKAGKRAVISMARNELAASVRSKSDFLTAVDIYKAPGENYIPAAVYYIETSRMESFTNAMKQVGMIHKETLLLPDCMAVTVCMMYKIRSALVIDAEEEGLGLYAASGGHCLAWRNSPLKAGRFCEKGAQALLYQEIAEQAMRISKQLEDEGISYKPELAVLLGTCLSDEDGAAQCLEEHLRIPCVKAELGRLGKNAAASPAALAGVAAGSLPGARRIKHAQGCEGEPAGMAGFLPAVLSRSFLLFLSANMILASIAAGYMKFLGNQEAEKLQELQACMSDSEFQETYRDVCFLKSEMEEEAARKELKAEVRKEASGLLTRACFEAFTSSMEPGTRVEAVIYDKEQGTLEMVLSQEHPEQAPSMVERVRASDIFAWVGHSLWEKREEMDTERVYVWVRGYLKEGEQNESE